MWPIEQKAKNGDCLAPFVYSCMRWRTNANYKATASNLIWILSVWVLSVPIKQISYNVSIPTFQINLRRNRGKNFRQQASCVIIQKMLNWSCLKTTLPNMHLLSFFLLVYIPAHCTHIEMPPTAGGEGYCELWYKKCFDTTRERRQLLVSLHQFLYTGSSSVRGVGLQEV